MNYDEKGGDGYFAYGISLDENGNLHAQHLQKIMSTKIPCSMRSMRSKHVMNEIAKAEPTSLEKVDDRWWMVDLYIKKIVQLVSFSFI